VARWLHGGGGSSQRDTRPRPEQFSAALLFAVCSLWAFLLLLFIFDGLSARAGAATERQIALGSHDYGVRSNISGSLLELSDYLCFEGKIRAGNADDADLAIRTLRGGGQDLNVISRDGRQRWPHPNLGSVGAG